LKSEIGILSRIVNPNVIGLYDIQKTVNNFYLFMQYCNGGDLDDLRELRGRFNEQEARYFLSQIIQGFKAINDMNVIHRDLKLANILVHFKNIEIDTVLQGGLQL
jgi:serine/threonine protein kinase